MKIGSSPIAPRPACDDLPTVETRGQCELPTAHLDERKDLEPSEVREAGGKLGKAAVGKVVEKVAIHKAEHAVPQSLRALVPTNVAHFAHGLLIAKTAVQSTMALEQFAKVFPEQAKLRAAAVGRENHDLAMAFVADQSEKGVFPAGYVASRRDTLMGGNAKLGDARHTPHVVNKVIAQMDTAVEANHAGAKQYVSYWATNARAGVREAQSRDVRDQPSLEAACKDPKFKAAFDDDAAFREGVRAGMWQAKTQPQAFDAARAAITSLRDQATQVQLGRPS